MCVETAGALFVDIVQNATKIRYYRIDRKRIEGTSRAVLPVIRSEKGGEKIYLALRCPIDKWKPWWYSIDEKRISV